MRHIFPTGVAWDDLDGHERLLAAVLCQALADARSRNDQHRITAILLLDDLCPRWRELSR